MQKKTGFNTQFINRKSGFAGQLGEQIAVDAEGRIGPLSCPEFSNAIQEVGRMILLVSTNKKGF